MEDFDQEIEEGLAHAEKMLLRRKIIIMGSVSGVLLLFTVISVSFSRASKSFTPSLTPTFGQAAFRSQTAPPSSTTAPTKTPRLATTDLVTFTSTPTIWMSSTPLKPSLTAKSACNEEIIQNVTTKRTNAGMVVTISCSSGSYAATPMSWGSYEIGPNKMFLVYLTGGSLYAMRVGKKTWKYIGDFAGEDSGKCNVSFIGTHPYQVRVECDYGGDVLSIPQAITYIKE